MENFEHLEGKEVLLSRPDMQDEPLKVKVAGCDRDIGLTIVLDEMYVDDDGYTLKPESEMICIHGPLSHHYYNSCEQDASYESHYDVAFDTLVREIEQGHIISRATDLLGITDSFCLGGMKCSFT